MNTPKLYDPTPAELADLKFDPDARCLASEGRAVLDLRGVTLSRGMAGSAVADPDALQLWRGLAVADLRLARTTAFSSRAAVTRVRQNQGRRKQRVAPR